LSLHSSRIDHLASVRIDEEAHLHAGGVNAYGHDIFFPGFNPAHKPEAFLAEYRADRRA
jgi:hypothetical protein